MGVGTSFLTTCSCFSVCQVPQRRSANGKKSFDRKFFFVPKSTSTDHLVGIIGDSAWWTLRSRRRGYDFNAQWGQPHARGVKTPGVVPFTTRLLREGHLSLSVSYDLNSIHYPIGRKKEVQRQRQTQQLSPGPPPPPSSPFPPPTNLHPSRF